MCGICGIHNFNQNDVNVNHITSMMSYMKHRGPDSDGVWSDANTGFGFVRLSIIDLSADGNQPMNDESNNFTIVFNGEIYNYIELRDELIQKGYNFRTKTDTEVLLKGYIEWGSAVLAKCNGMFAFAIHNKITGEIFAARDRYGVKPFYYYYDNDKFVFCSEIVPILKTFPELRKVNDESIYNYFVFNRTDYNEDTFIENIKRLPHGSYLTINKEVKIHEWYNLKERVSLNESNSNLKDLLVSSIGLRLRSDVPVGLCLSGGLDSSSIASILLNNYGLNGLQTFSAVYSKSYEFDETEYINEYKGLLNNMNFITPSADTLFEDKEKFVLAQGEPVPSTSPYAQYKVMQLAHGKVKVTLDGQGADEQLAGYHYFYGNYFKELFLTFKFLKLFNEIRLNYKIHNSLYSFKTFLYFMLPENMKTGVRAKKYGYLNNDFNNLYKNNNFISGKLYSSGSLNEALLNHFNYKLEHLLKWEDRNSMNFSIEARLPFLDYRIVEYILSLPSSSKIYKGQTKFILREEMKGILPEKIRKRHSKIGFDTPEDNWFRSKSFIEFVNDIISSNVFRQSNYFNVNAVKNLHNDHISNKRNVSKEIWKWINYYLWYENIIKS